jgi:hypothetical protein
MAKKPPAEDVLLKVISGKKKQKPEVALLDVVSGKRKRKDKAITEKLISILPKQDDPLTQELVETVQQFTEQIDQKKANALGLSLINILNKANSIEDIQAKEEIKIKFGDIISVILKDLLEQNDPKYQDIFHIAVGLLYKYLNEDIKKILRRQKDVLDGKVQYYKDEPGFFLGGDAGVVDDAYVHELEQKVDQLTYYLNLLEVIYTTLVINTTNSPYQFNYNTANVLLGDATNGMLLIKLPPAIDNIGRPFIVRKTDSSSFGIEVRSYSSEPITGPNIIFNQNDILQFYTADGVNWYSTDSVEVLGCFLVSEMSFQWSNFDANLTWADLRRIEFRRQRPL